MTKKRKRLFQQFKDNRNEYTKMKLKNLNKQIKVSLKNEKIRKIRNKINPNDQASLWKAVKVAKNISFSTLPPTLIYNNIEANNDQSKADMMMDFFEKKN